MSYFDRMAADADTTERFIDMMCPDLGEEGEE